MAARMPRKLSMNASMRRSSSSAVTFGDCGSAQARSQLLWSHSLIHPLLLHTCAVASKLFSCFSPIFAFTLCFYSLLLLTETQLSSTGIREDTRKQRSPPPALFKEEPQSPPPVSAAAHAKHKRPSGLLSARIPHTHKTETLAPNFISLARECTN